MASPERIPALTQDDSAEIQNGLTSFQRPPHACSFESLTDERLAPSFDDATADGEALSPVLRVVHVPPVPCEVSKGFTDRLMFRTGANPEAQPEVPDSTNHLLCAALSLLEDLAVLVEPGLRRCCPFSIEGMRDLRDLSRGMVKVEDVNGIPELRMGLEVV